MLARILFFADVALFRRGPSEAPAGTLPMAMALALYALIETIGLRLFTLELNPFPRIALDISLSVAVIYALLRWRGHTARLAQTATALFGAQAMIDGVLLGLFHLPGALQVLGLLVFFWAIGVTGFVFREALEIELPYALMIAFVMNLLGVVIIESLLPTPA